MSEGHANSLTLRRRAGYGNHAQFQGFVPGQLDQTTRLVRATLHFESSPLGARRAIATMPQFQGSGEVPKRADTLGTPNTCRHV